MPRSRTRQAALCSGVLTAVLAAGCSSHATAKPLGIAALDDQGSKPAPCMNHQTHEIDPAFNAGGDVAVVLRLLRYYTSNGARAYCDGKLATSTDLAWMRLYVADGGAQAKVARWLGPA